MSAKPEPSVPIEHPPFYSVPIAPPPGVEHHFEAIGYAVVVDAHDGVGIRVLDLVRKSSGEMHARKPLETIPLREAARLPPGVKVTLRREVERLKESGQWPANTPVPAEITATGW